MFNINDLKPGTIFTFNNQPFEVIEAKHLHLARGGALLQTKIKNLKTGAVLKQSFKPSDSFKEADVSRETVKYIYNYRRQYFFCDPKDLSKRFSLPKDKIGDKKNFLKEEMLVETIEFDNEILDIILPIKVNLKVSETPPDFKGNTAQGGTKPAVLETGAEIKVPFFVKNGDTVIVNTQKGEYVERAKGT